MQLMNVLILQTTIVDILFSFHKLLDCRRIKNRECQSNKLSLCYQKNNLFSFMKTLEDKSFFLFVLLTSFIWLERNEKFKEEKRILLFLMNYNIEIVSAIKCLIYNTRVLDLVNP